jgi:hypothetical protein
VELLFAYHSYSVLRRTGEAFGPELSCFLKDCTVVDGVIGNRARQIAQFGKIIAIPVVIICSAFLLNLLDDGLGLGWTHNVVRNWQEFGLFNLHGQLVFNAGGFEATTRPEIYKGISPVFLYLAYFSTELFGWTGLGTLSFHILLALAVFWATWELLGRNNFAFTTAIITVLLPGYLRWQKILDPCAIPVLLSLPYIAIILPILKKPHLKMASLAGLFAVTLCFTSLNWSTAWVCGPCALLLWFLPTVERRRTILFVALLGVSCALLGVVSVISKAGAGGTGSGSLLQFILSYTWGNTGYGLNLTTGTTMLRLVFVNGVGLLPLLVIFGYVVGERFRRGQRIWPHMWPLAAAVMDMVIMRNYFGHHPWLAAPLLLVGLIFSLILLRTDNVIGAGPADLQAAFTQHTALGVVAIFLCCFIYGLGVLFFFRANEANILSLIHFVRHETGRSDLILLVKDRDPQTAQFAPRFSEIFDRRVMVINELSDLPVVKSRAVILSAVPLTSKLKLLAQSNNGETKALSWDTKVADWFNKSIARRQPGDRLEVAVTYFLYDVAAEN